VYQGLFLWGVKRPGREADHSPLSRAKVKQCVEKYLHSHNTPSWRGITAAAAAATTTITTTTTTTIVVVIVIVVIIIIIIIMS
jgi:hypothetical protein